MKQTIITLLFLLGFQASAHAGANQNHLPRFIPVFQDPGIVTYKSKYFIKPKHAVTPFHQWNSNNGYCGEVSVLQAGMNQGMWMSQYNSRLICGTGLSQSGPDGFCESHSGSSNYNAQVLLENINPGDNRFASAAVCLQNSRLAFETYDYSSNPAGSAGYIRYMTWIKSQLIAGNQVAIAVLNHGGGDPQYDHEVTVTQIGTDHDVSDPIYYGDDVLYFEDHTYGGQPFVNGYKFDALAHSREDANDMLAGPYSILIPGKTEVLSAAGGDGINNNPHPIVAQNYAFAVSGPADRDHVTLPVALTIEGSSVNGVANTTMHGVGFNFENPSLDHDCTNAPPKNWMGITLKATVSGLTIGQAYNLYRYEFNGVSGIGDKAMLSIPDADFNARAGEATQVTSFVATEATYAQSISTTSDKIVVLRCVPADAP